MSTLTTRAFPSTYDDGEDTIHQWGMTLRDYFAAKAMQAMLSSEFQMSGSVAYIDRNGGKLEDHVSACAYDMADAMIKAREE